MSEYQMARVGVRKSLSCFIIERECVVVERQSTGRSGSPFRLDEGCIAGVRGCGRRGK